MSRSSENLKGGEDTKLISQQRPDVPEYQSPKGQKTPLELFNERREKKMDWNLYIQDQLHR